MPCAKKEREKKEEDSDKNQQISKETQTKANISTEWIKTKTNSSKLADQIVGTTNKTELRHLNTQIDLIYQWIFHCALKEKLPTVSSKPTIMLTHLFFWHPRLFLKLGISFENAFENDGHRGLAQTWISQAWRLVSVRSK